MKTWKLRGDARKCRVCGGELLIERNWDNTPLAVYCETCGVQYHWLAVMTYIDASVGG